MDKSLINKDLQQYVIFPDSDGTVDINLSAGEERTFIISGAIYKSSDIKVNVNVGRNSGLTLYHVVSAEEKSSASFKIHQDADSRVRFFTAMLGNGDAINNIDAHLDAPNADFRLDGIVIPEGAATGAYNVAVNHHLPHCTSNQDFKYLLRGTSRGLFNGLIRVDHDAHHTEAFQSNRNILVGEHARMETLPQLEIYCDEVKCSHGSATGELDQQALFYMRSRGIGLDEARSMLMNAFLSDIIDRIELTPLRDEIRNRVQSSLAQ